jgi:hypothetical protein
MLNKEFVKLLRLLKGRSEVIRTRFELDGARGCLVEHVTLETHDSLPEEVRRAAAGFAALRAPP